MRRLILSIAIAAVLGWVAASEAGGDHGTDRNVGPDVAPRSAVASIGP